MPEAWTTPFAAGVAVSALAFATIELCRRRRHAPLQTAAPLTAHEDLRAVSTTIPAVLTNEYYFDLTDAEARGIAEHAAYLRRTHDIGAALDGLQDLAQRMIEDDVTALRSGKFGTEQKREHAPKSKSSTLPHQASHMQPTMP